MDWALLVFLLLTLYLVWRGYRAGLLPSIARLASLVAGYLAAFLYTRALAAKLEAVSDLQGIAALLIASLVLFVGAAFTVALLFRSAAWLLGGERGPGTLSRAGGAAIGLVNGVLLSFLLIWAGGFVRDLYQAGELAAAGTAATAPAAAAPAGRTARLVDDAAEFALGKAMEIGDVDPAMAEVGAALIRSPDQVLGLALRLAHGPQLAELFGNRANHPVLDSGDLAALQRLPAFQRLAAHPDMRALFTALRAADVDDPVAYSAVLAARISDTWRRTRAVERDPRVRQILADADFRANLAAGNPLALINDAQLLELVQIVLAAEPAAPVPLADAAAPADGADVAPARRAAEAPAAPREPARIYRWRDASGRLIYSDEPPPEQ